MAKKGTILYALMMIIGIVFIIIVPIGVLSINLSLYGIINYTDSPFEYRPDIPSPVEKLILDVDIGNIEIKYVEPTIDNYVSIYVNLEMAGPGLGGKGYMNYFNITRSEIGSSEMYFSIKLLAIDSILSLIKDISITVNLRKGIIFDISANIENGNVDIHVPYKVQVSNMNVNIANGNFTLTLYKSIIEGNITGIIDNGRVVLKSTDAIYTQKCKWNLSSEITKVVIIQNNPLGANVTGIISTTLNFPTNLIYNDINSEVGAKFTIYNYKPPFWNGTYKNFFEFALEPVGINRYTSKSYDFPANYNYVFLLYIEGMLYFDLSST